MKKAFTVRILFLSLVALNLCGPAVNAEELSLELLYGARVAIPGEWQDLGSALDFRNQATIQEELKEIAKAETAPELPLISIGSKTGSPPTMITVLYRDCPEGACPGPDYFQNLIDNAEEVRKEEEKDLERAARQNAEQGHKTLQHFPMEVKRECDAYYSIAGGQEVSMYGKIDYVSKIKVIYSEDRLLGMTIGYPSSDRDHGRAAEQALNSFGCN